MGKGKPMTLSTQQLTVFLLWTGRAAAAEAEADAGCDMAVVEIKELLWLLLG